MKSVKKPTRHSTSNIANVTSGERAENSEAPQSYWDERKAALDNMVKVNNDPNSTLEQKFEALERHQDLVAKLPIC